MDAPVAHGGEYALSGAGLLELMGAALARGASFRFTARGFSMDPFVRDGDVLTVARSRRRPGLGQVIAVRDPAMGRLVVHRVVAHAGAGVLVRGDGAGQADGVAARGRARGVVASSAAGAACGRPGPSVCRSRRCPSADCSRGIVVRRLLARLCHRRSPSLARCCPQLSLRA